MDREEAIKRIRERLEKEAWAVDEYDMAALETVIPELTESEDKRISKEIIHFLLYDAGTMISEDTEHRWVAWLQKQKDAVGWARQQAYEEGMEDGMSMTEQKEQKPVEWSEDEKIRKWLFEYINAHAWREDYPIKKQEILAYLEKQKEPLPIPDKFNGLKSLMLQYLQSAANRKDDTEIESDTDLFGRKILDYVWKQEEKQKEQKPGEDIFDDPRYLEGFDTGREVQKVFDEQKPADQGVKGRRGRIGNTPKHIRKKAEAFLATMEPPYDADDICSAYEIGAAENAKPAEWSEEDEMMLSSIIETLKYTNGAANMKIAWLKSLSAKIK